MEAYFDNKNNVVNTCIRSSVDKSELYKVKTTFSFRGRQRTIMQDANPSPGGPVTVGAIHWDEGLLEVLGVKKKLSDVKRHEGSFLRKHALYPCKRIIILICSLELESGNGLLNGMNTESNTRTTTGRSAF